MNFLLESAVCLTVTPQSDRGVLINRMSTSGLTSEAQLRYLLQWFGEFSELQREDFLPILAAARGGKADQLAATLAALSCEDKPVSLFQCRIKLFNEWYPSWAEEEQDRLIKGVTEVDADFGEKLQDYLTNGPPVNGEFNAIIGERSGHEEVNIVENNVEADQWNGAEPVPDAAEEEQGISQENIPVEIAAAS